MYKIKECRFLKIKHYFANFEDTALILAKNKIDARKLEKLYDDGMIQQDNYNFDGKTIIAIAKF